MQKKKHCLNCQNNKDSCWQKVETVWEQIPLRLHKVIGCNDLSHRIHKVKHKNKNLQKEMQEGKEKKKKEEQKKKQKKFKRRKCALNKKLKF